MNRIVFALIFVALVSVPRSASGQLWFPVGAGAEDDVEALVSITTGPAPGLYAGGDFTDMDGVPGTSAVARWDGNSWTSVGPGLTGGVTALGEFNGDVLVGSGFLTLVFAGSPVLQPARWDGTSWVGLGGGTAGNIGAFVAYNPTGVPGATSLAVGGSFSMIGGVTAANVAHWNGTSWSSLGSGLGAPVSALEVFDPGTGPTIFAADSQGIHRYDLATSSWSLVAPVTGFVDDMVVLAGALHVCGANLTDVGGVAVSNVARWSGTGSWTSVGNGVQAPRSMAVFDDGSGSTLWIGEDVSPYRVLKLDLTNNQWVTVGEAFSEDVEALAEFGGSLFAAGDFVSNGSRISARIAELHSRALGTRPGSLDDLDRLTGVDAPPDPSRDLKSITANDTLHVSLVSFGAAYVGTVPLILGDLFTTGNPPSPICPLSPQGAPYGTLYFDVNSVFPVFDGTAATFVQPVLIPPIGLHFSWNFPALFAGQSLVIQGLALWPNPSTPYVATNAHELTIF